MTGLKNHRKMLGSALQEKSKAVDWGTSKKTETFCLFSKKGFTKELIDHAKANGILLVERDGLLL